MAAHDDEVGAEILRRLHDDIYRRTCDYMGVGAAPDPGEASATKRPSSSSVSRERSNPAWRAPSASSGSCACSTCSAPPVCRASATANCSEVRDGSEKDRKSVV